METLEELRSELPTHRERIFNLCLGMLRGTDSPYDEAHDMTGETMRRATRSLGGFRGDSKLETWLYRIAVNVCKNRMRELIDHWNHEGVSFDEPMLSTDGEVSSLDTLSAELQADPLEALLVQSRQKTVVRAVEMIRAKNPQYAHVLMAREFQGKSYKEIAKECEMTVQAVKSSLFRARGLLKVRLTRAKINGEL